ncbi:MAG: LacI family DNA-binding transcriptional regulator [Sediminispirochaetaceae bacterium]
MASQQDVARMANVSLMTVSRVVNGDPKVKPATRERVQQAIETLNYYPNAAARALNSRKTMTVGLMLPRVDYVLSEPYFSQLIYNIEKSLTPRNYDLLIGTAEHRNGRDLTLLYNQKKVDGLIIIGSQINDPRLQALSDNCIPAVLIHARSTLPCLSYVDVDNFKIIEYFVDYLCSLGHRRIGFIAGDLSVVNAYHRLIGYKQSLSTRSILVEDRLLFNGDWSSHSGYEAFLYFKSLSNPPTAIIASNDHMAIGFLKAAYEHNVDIPRDLSLVGIDDIEMASFTTPKITTMRQPMHDIASLAVDALIDSINSEPPRESRVILDAEVVLRDSCGPRPAS